MTCWCRPGRRRSRCAKLLRITCIATSLQLRGKELPLGTHGSSGAMSQRPKPLCHPRLRRLPGILSAMPVSVVIWVSSSFTAVAKAFTSCWFRHGAMRMNCGKRSMRRRALRRPALDFLHLIHHIAEHFAACGSSALFGMTGWKRFLLSKRGPDDVALYLDDGA